MAQPWECVKYTHTQQQYDENTRKCNDGLCFSLFFFFFFAIAMRVNIYIYIYTHTNGLLGETKYKQNSVGLVMTKTSLFFLLCVCIKNTNTQNMSIMNTKYAQGLLFHLFILIL